MGLAEEDQPPSSHPTFKLIPKFFNPYKVLERLGKIAYRLRLPPQANVHPVFHVSCLKPFMREPPAEILMLAGLEPSPCQIVCTRRARRQECLVDEVLVEKPG